MRNPRITRKFIDITGLKFHRWTVMSPIFTGKIIKWSVQCDCGTIKSVSSQALRTGTTKSCGCLKIELQNSKKVPIEEQLRKRAVKAAIAAKTPKRREQKRMAQLRYRITDQAALSQFKRWAKKKNKEIKITEEEYIKFRALPCHKCNKAIERTGVCFILLEPRGDIVLSNMAPTCGICKLIKPSEKFDIVVYARNVLRRFWKRTPMAAIARQKARKAVGRYECNKCKELFREKDVQIDHILPVVDPIEGFKNLDEFANRLFCSDNNLQILCKRCHNEKSTSENKIRREIKRSNK